MRGLPIGHGEVWHDPDQRRMLLGMAALALVPFVGLMLLGWGLASFDGYATWVAAPAIGLLTALAAFAWQRHPALFKRLAIGALAGFMGALACDTVRLVGEAFGWFSGGSALGLPVAGPAPAWAALAEGTFVRWVVLGALWGVAYGLVAGKAGWAYGAAAGMWLGGVTLVASWLAPHGQLFGPAMTLVGALSWMVGAALFGAVMGGLNEALQPDPRFGGKIIFLRDYQARVHQRK